MRNHLVMFCCNDERGVFAGRVEQVSIGNEIELVWPGDRAPALRIFAGMLQVGRGKRYPFWDRRTCVGNIFWDSVKMDEGTARSLVEYLLAIGFAVELFAEDGPFTDLARSAA